ncbi:putative RNA-directed DNA polymerase from transposon BS [Trichonephila clavipes]|nr:putative RNA-directed DNA polymerase from transposon BS [Trichonephila clavipes]
MSWLLYQLVHNPACLVVPGGAWMGSCIAERGLSRGHYWLLTLGQALPNWSSENQKEFSSSFPKKKIQNKKKTQNASIKTPIPPYPSHDAKHMDDTVLLLPKFTVDEIAQHTRFLILSLPNNEMCRKSPFVIHKALLGIGGEPKSIKKLRSGDLLIETISAVQSKSFLLAKTFIDSPLIVTPHRTLNSCRGVISESDLLYASETEILEDLSDQGVTQVRRIKIKKETSLFPTKHLILTFNSPQLPSNIKAGYLNCKLRPYIPNPLRCFKCQRFGHSQNSCRGQLTCSRCAAVGHSSTDCTLEPKCINCSQPHTADSKLCPKWKTEKQIQEIKTNRNITYVEARKLIVPQTSHTYAQAAKSSNKTSSTQTDENITKIKCPPLELLQPLSSTTRTNVSISTPDVSTSSSSTQAQLLPSTSSISTCNSESQPPIPTCTDAPSNNMVTPIESSSSIIPTSSSQSVLQPPSDSNTVQDAKKLAKARSRKRKKELLKKMKEAIIDIKMNPHRPKKPASDESTTDEEEMIVYDVEDEIDSNPDYVKQNDPDLQLLMNLLHRAITRISLVKFENLLMIGSNGFDLTTKGIEFNTESASTVQVVRILADANSSFKSLLIQSGPFHQ